MDQLNDVFSDHIFESNKKVVENLLSSAADVILIAFVNIILENSLIDIDALKNDFDDKKHD